MANEQNLIPAKPGEIRNPNGRPKGSKNWSTLVQEMMEDEQFVVKMLDPKSKKEVEVKYPAKAITETMIKKALAGDVGAAKWLRETGYGNKITVHSDLETRRVRERYNKFLDADPNDLSDDSTEAEAASTE